MLISPLAKKLRLQPGQRIMMQVSIDETWSALRFRQLEKVEK